MQALREGRSWVDHGHLVNRVEVEVTGGGPAGRGRGHAGGRQVSATLGGRIRVRRGPVTLRLELVAEHSGYLRLRGSDGNRHGVGPLGAAVDPHGPVPHDGTPDAGNPWADTWFYTNPVFVDVV